MSEDEGNRLMAFNCPSCGETNPIKGDPERLTHKIFACEGCGENVLLENHVENRGEAV